MGLLWQHAVEQLILRVTTVKNRILPRKLLAYLYTAHKASRVQCTPLKMPFTHVYVKEHMRYELSYTKGVVHTNIRTTLRSLIASVT